LVNLKPVIIPILGSPVCEWLPYIAAFNLLMTPSLGSPGSEWLHHTLVHFKPADNACPHIQGVSGCHALMHLKPAEKACACLSRE
jgi:hypothetical protein